MLRAREPSAKLHQAQLAVAATTGCQAGGRSRRRSMRSASTARSIAATLAGKARDLGKLLAAHPRKISALSAGHGTRRCCIIAADAAISTASSLLLRRGFDVGQARQYRPRHRAALGGGRRSSRGRQAPDRRRRRYRRRRRRPRSRRDRLGDLLQGRRTPRSPTICSPAAPGLRSSPRWRSVARTWCARW